MKVLSIDDSNAFIFDDELMKAPVFVKFYHPNCGHCVAMKDAWNNMSKELKNKYDGDMSIIEVHADAIPKINNTIKNNIPGYPTIMKIDKGGKIKKEYNGDRSQNDMMEFIKNNFSIEEKKQSGGKKSRKVRNSRKSRKLRKSIKSRKYKKKTSCIGKKDGKKGCRTCCKTKKHKKKCIKKCMNYSKKPKFQIESLKTLLYA